ncbi:hypothetical protein JX265_011277 [Neoarthrinium moseri]|uniref:Transmembrane protein n=1 Tax=Neoarthrinium moseri TaxID=1658444 RepID=A0A9P9WCN9_9PEZI|nr:uncharacterized protein JN550_006374 [Neoarthrinium moseri]KAI1849060.1 hypothetical protein JX266_005021 [Neoarthrinium moseri]KAI1857076.1 hypothetical protein JX265_011277 [Neoarthrinium moseri]KAI1868458.1 hypothetical protein JN550_006374 [Neoarthrinium moseri]
MLAPTLIPNRAVTVVAVTAQPELVQRQMVITQTITYPASTLTTVVTLGRGGESTAVLGATTAPAAPVSASTSSQGLTPEQIGIIVGCCVGAAVFVVLLWCCCTAVRRRPGSDTSDGDSYYSHDEVRVPVMPEPPRRMRWPEWRTRPPPVVPTYRALPIGPRYTANRASARASTTYVRR